MNMKQLELFPIDVTLKELDALEHLSEADKTWLMNMDSELRSIGIAWLKWKKKEIKKLDKLSRPQLWMEGFMFGLEFASKKLERFEEESQPVETASQTALAEKYKDI